MTKLYMYIQFIKSDKHLPQSPFTGKVFKMTTFCFGAYKVNKSRFIIIDVLYKKIEMFEQSTL
jgi:hypothetical protein